MGLRKNFRLLLFKTGDTAACLCGDRNEPGENKHEMKPKRPESPAPHRSASRTRCGGPTKAPYLSSQPFVEYGALCQAAWTQEPHQDPLLSGAACGASSQRLYCRGCKAWRSRLCLPYVVSWLCLAPCAPRLGGDDKTERPFDT